MGERRDEESILRALSSSAKILALAVYSGFQDLCNKIATKTAWGWLFIEFQVRVEFGSSMVRVRVDLRVSACAFYIFHSIRSWVLLVELPKLQLPNCKLPGKCQTGALG